MHQNVKAFGTYRENIVKRELVMNYEKEERYLSFSKIRVGIWNKNWMVFVQYFRSGDNLETFY